MGCSASSENRALPGRQLSIHACHEAQAPMWVVRVADVLRMKGKLPAHQTLAREGLLWRCEGSLLKSWVIFVSHQWMGFRHPDPFREQLQVLQEALQGLLSEQLQIEQDAAVQYVVKGGRTLSKSERRQLEHAYIWLDYFSVPQMVPEAPVSREEQLKYINSIPHYVESCEVFIALVPKTVHEKGHMCGESSWLQRGWCRVEMWCKLLSDRSDIPIILLTGSNMAQFATPRWLLYPVHSAEFAVEEDRASCSEVIRLAFERKVAELGRRGDDLDRYRILTALLEQSVGLPRRTRDLEGFLKDFRFKNLEEDAGMGPIACAALAGDCDLIRSLFAAKASLQTKTRLDAFVGVVPGWTPMHLATNFGQDVGAMQVLLELRADIHASSGHTPAPLNQCRSPEAVDLLVKHGAMVNAATSDLKWPPLHSLAMTGAPMPTFAKLLELRAEPNGHHGLKGGSAPLGMLAVLGNADPELIPKAQLLIDWKANVNHFYEPEGVWRVIELGCRAYSLFRTPPFAVHVFGNMSTSPLGFACMYGCEDLALFLLRAKADPEVRNHRGLRPIDLAKTQKLKRLMTAPPQDYQFLSDGLVRKTF